MKELLRRACSRMPVMERYMMSSQVGGNVGRCRKGADAMYHGEFCAVKRRESSISGEVTAQLMAATALIVTSPCSANITVLIKVVWPKFLLSSLHLVIDAVAQLAIAHTWDLEQSYLRFLTGAWWNPINVLGCGIFWLGNNWNNYI